MPETEITLFYFKYYFRSIVRIWFEQLEKGESLFNLFHTLVGIQWLFVGLHFTDIFWFYDFKILWFYGFIVLCIFIVWRSAMYDICQFVCHQRRTR